MASVYTLAPLSNALDKSRKTPLSSRDEFVLKAL